MILSRQDICHPSNSDSTGNSLLSYIGQHKNYDSVQPSTIFSAQIQQCGFHDNNYYVCQANTLFVTEKENCWINCNLPTPPGFIARYSLALAIASDGKRSPTWGLSIRNGAWHRAMTCRRAESKEVLSTKKQPFQSTYNNTLHPWTLSNKISIDDDKNLQQFGNTGGAKF